MHMKIVRPGGSFSGSVSFAVTAVVVAVIASGCGVFAPGSADRSPVGPSDVQRTASPYPAAQRPDLERALVQLASANGSGAIALLESAEETWRGASGLASGDRPAAPGDRFAIASTTKTFVATVVLQLVGEGGLSLDDSVEGWLPERVRDGKRITIRQLLNHTSGIGMDFGLRPLESQPPLLSEPGSEHRYSNTNYDILGLIVERLTRQSLDAVVRDRIFRPLGLQDTSYGSVSPARDARDLSPWLGVEAFEPSGIVSGAGGIVSTAADLATFFRALLRGDVLPDRQLAEMLRTVDTVTDPLAGQAGARPRAGLGIFDFELACGSAWGHGGDMPWYSNQVLASPNGSKILVVAQNTTGWAGANATALEMFCL